MSQVDLRNKLRYYDFSKRYQEINFMIKLMKKILPLLTQNIYLMKKLKNLILFLILKKNFYVLKLI